MNNITTTNRHIIWTKDANGNRLQINIALVEREGVTTDMVYETLQHFRMLCWALANENIHRNYSTGFIKHVFATPSSCRMRAWMNGLRNVRKTNKNRRLKNDRKH